MEPAGACDITRTVFFDNGLLRALLNGNFQGQLEDRDSDLRAALKLPFRPWRTPFSVMEWIGLDSESLPRPIPFDPDSAHATEFITPAYHHYERHYDSVRELDRENLERLAIKQRDYVTTGLVDIWDAVMGGFFDEGNVSGWLRFALAFDAVHKLDVPNDHRRDYWSDLMAGAFFKADRCIRNLSKFRLAYRMWIRRKDKLNYSGAPATAIDCIREAHDLLSIGNWKDYLDGDLIHVAAAGVEDSNGNTHRVACLTCDRPEVVIMRLRLYKGLLSYVRKLYRAEADAEGCPTDYESTHNGEVCCFDGQGCLVRRIDVTSETPPLPFLGTEPS